MEEGEGSLGPETGRGVDAGMEGAAVGAVVQMLVVGVGAQSWGLGSLLGSQEGSGAVVEGLGGAAWSLQKKYRVWAEAVVGEQVEALESRAGE